MGLRFILGKPGTGKTSLCLREINERLDDNAPLYYLVPEQFSLQSERLLLSNRAAATQVQVLSFNRLAYRLFATFGGAPGRMADDLGRQMLLRKVLFEIGDQLTYYKSAADKHGFVETLADTVTEMNHYRITADDLALRAANSPPALAAKLNDLALISRAYRELVAGRYLLTDDMLELLCGRLENVGDVPLLDGACFWVDGFSGFTPQERHVLKHIMKRASNVSVTLTTAADLRLTPPQITIDKLTKLAQDARIKVEPTVKLDKNLRHSNSPGLTVFVDNFTMLPNQANKAKLSSINLHSDKFQLVTHSNQLKNLTSDILEQIRDNAGGDIQLIAAPDRYAAANTAAALILQWVNEDNYRFRDIAILCGDRTHYEKILHTTFDRLNIPLFVDTEIDILSHPLTELIRASLDIIIRNYSFESVFRFLKTRMTTLPLQTIDILENYALEHGISSYRWRYNFKDPTAEAARQELLSIFPKTRATTKATVQNHCRRIFDMLYALNVPATLQAWYETHMQKGDHATARLHKQIWPKICEIFDKLVEMLGDEEVTVKTFAAILDAGFNQVGLGRVPPTIDQVVLGDIGRSRYPEIKAMLVLGANENVLPGVPSQAGLFTDRERQLLDNQGLEVAAENMHRITESYYSLYCALSQPSEKLVLMYSDAEPGGRPLRPSPVIARIREIFPEIQIQQAPKISEYGTPMSSPKTNDYLSQESTSRLYGNEITTAASRLESFARCPFAYFTTYILEAKPRKKFEVLSADIGTLFHDVLAQFSKRVWEKGNSGDLTRTDIARHIDDIISTLPLADIYDNARNQHILSKVRRTSAASIWALCEHLKQGEFVPTLTEQEIRTPQGIILPNGKTLNLTGYVDRVDTLKTDNDEYIKIIDYKSGNTKFNIEEARQGVQLQLMIYMNVLTAMRNAKPGGMFYFPISDPLLDSDIQLDDKLREAGLLKQFKMSGIALADENTLKAIDKNLIPGTGSNIIPLAINKDGRFKKSTQPTALSLNNFVELGKEVEEKIKDLGERMTKGDISAAPYTKGNKSPCKFCNYGAICGKH